MDATTLGTTAARLMDELADRFDGFEDAELGTVLILAEVNIPSDGPEGSSGIYFRASDARKWIQQGMLHYALNSATESDEDDDGES